MRFSTYDLSFVMDLMVVIGAYRQQDKELKEVSAGVARIGGVGLTVHKVFLGQVRTSQLAFLCDASCICHKSTDKKLCLTYILSFSVKNTNVHCC